MSHPGDTDWEVPEDSTLQGLVAGLGWGCEANRLIAHEVAAILFGVGFC